MKQYKMATVATPNITKQSLKFMEIPLKKFSDEVIPHHQRMLEQHKNYIHKLMVLNDVRQLQREIKDKKRAIKQLRDLLYELDTLRTQILDEDLDGFDTRTMPLRNAILKLTRLYQDIENSVDRVAKPSVEDTSPSSYNERVNPFEGAASLRLQEDIDALKLQQDQARFNGVKEIEQKTEDLRSIQMNLKEMVQNQGEMVTEVETEVTSAEANVHTGLTNILHAHKLNGVAYPAAGAFVGTLIGGPIGLLAGLKVGGLAALGCAVAGYAGGKILKNQKDDDLDEAEHVINNENNENLSEDKKDI